MGQFALYMPWLLAGHCHDRKRMSHGNRPFNHFTVDNRYILQRAGGITSIAGALIGGLIIG
jgi:hypothetical protein